jgi:hypothetical protein
MDSLMDAIQEKIVELEKRIEELERMFRQMEPGTCAGARDAAPQPPEVDAIVIMDLDDIDVDEDFPGDFDIGEELPES